MDIKKGDKFRFKEYPKHIETVIYISKDWIWTVSSINRHLNKTTAWTLENRYTPCVTNTLKKL